MRLKTDTSAFLRDMENVIEYSIGFLDGAKSGQKEMLKSLGEKTKEVLESYIDSNARINPAFLQHVYDWNSSGSSTNRLFEINYTVRGNGLSMGYTFRQSNSVKPGSTTPFYDKARIMEQGIPVIISPRKSDVLAFEADGKTVFTKKSVTVESPGGAEAAGGFQKTIDDFFNNYYSQAFFNSGGILKNLSNPMEYNISRSRGGRNAGRSSGYRWITRAIPND